MTDRDRLIELITEFYGVDPMYYGVDVNALADHLLANGVIVPPCKVGDTVWINYEYYKGKPFTYPVKVYAYRFDTKKTNMRICVKGDIEIDTSLGSYTHRYLGTFAWDSVGKSVFLTKEEAEAELRKRSNEV